MPLPSPSYATLSETYHVDLWLYQSIDKTNLVGLAAYQALVCVQRLLPMSFP
jgi:hypothetical protein